MGAIMITRRVISNGIVLYGLHPKINLLRSKLCAPLLLLSLLCLHLRLLNPPPAVTLDSLQNVITASVAELKDQFHQPKRLGALNKFEAGEYGILICTDVASRGLDIPPVEMVINYDIPSNSMHSGDLQSRWAKSVHRGTSQNSMGWNSQKSAAARIAAAVIVGRCRPRRRCRLPSLPAQHHRRRGKPRPPSSPKTEENPDGLSQSTTPVHPCTIAVAAVPSPCRRRRLTVRLPARRRR
ncbi:hypothetical protein MRB53_018696 [Persea americana]|uniref:Uncharacterized protein n=1 Tax=Persea americana TaxID=3435 RepID=A0ACC2MA18_PERAE|nr:hypothetical protein MRB53_018696 [Persea americana]